MLLPMCYWPAELFIATKLFNPLKLCLKCMNLSWSQHTTVPAGRTQFIPFSGATALQGLGRQSGRRRSAKLMPTFFADRGVSRGQRNGSPRPLISVYRTWIATYFIQVNPQLTSRGSWGWVYPVPDPLPLSKSGSAGNRTRDLCICSQKLWPLDHRGDPIYSLVGHNSYTLE